MLPTIEMVPLNKLRPNIWRDLKRNPIDPEKVEQIAESIIATGEMWVGVYGRKMPDGTVQLAFGHTRAEAAKLIDTGDFIEAAKSAGLKTIPVAIKEFTDAEMLMRMTRENLRGDLPVVLEAVSAAVRALAEGKIEIEAPERTNPASIRYAPSFVPGKKPTSASEAEVPYTASTLAKFLGGIYTKLNKGKLEPQNSVVAALGILELEEKRIQGFSEKVYADKPIREIIPMVSDIKKRTEAVQERRGKTQQELAELREKQLAAQKKLKEDEKNAEEARKEFLRKEAEARRAENERKADELAAKRKEADVRAKEKEVLNKLRMAQLEEQLKAKKEWEAQQRIQDAYMPIRRDVENMISKLETIVSERNPFREDVKSLSTRKGLRPEDRLRLRKAVVAVADWFNDWVAPQFAPELKAAQKIAAEKRKSKETK